MGSVGVVSAVASLREVFRGSMAVSLGNVGSECRRLDQPAPPLLCRPGCVYKE